jgi:hypothetical protein
MVLLQGIHTHIKEVEAMTTIITPENFETEEIMNIPVAGSGAQCRVVSGYANFYDFINNYGEPIDSPIKGDPDDDDTIWITHEVHMVVGPKWTDVRDVSPSVFVAGFSFRDSDSADRSGTEIMQCTWDTVGLSEGQTNFERIRLKVNLRLCGGEEYSIIKLGYHLVAVGR